MTQLDRNNHMEQDQPSRRQARRIPIPVDVELTTAEGKTTAVVRDATLGNNQETGFIGVGILHRNLLPLDEPVACETLTTSYLLPKHSNIILMWTRHFGSDGYLSGGRMKVNEPAQAVQNTTETSGF